MSKRTRAHSKRARAAGWTLAINKRPAPETVEPEVTVTPEPEVVEVVVVTAADLINAKVKTLPSLLVHVTDVEVLDEALKGEERRVAKRHLNERRAEITE